MDKTIIYYTSNREDPVFEQKIIDDMLSKAGNIPIISVSQKPMKLGRNVCIGDVGFSSLNCRKQILMAAKLAKTEYVIAAESDSIYPPEYFNFKPTGNKFYRYENVWIMWLKENRKNFYHKRGTYDGAQIVKREFLISLLEKYLEPYPGWYVSNDRDRRTKTPHSPYNVHRTYIPGENPCISIKTGFGLQHTTGVNEDPESTRKNLPYWGNVGTLRAKFS